MTLIVFLMVNCTTMGPTTIPRDRFDYAAAISDSWNNQMLLNLVKARYAEAPVFLDIASAINSYSLETDASVAAGFQTPLASNADSLGLGAGSKFTDRPTITYSPLIGEKFSKSLMTPIRPGALLALMQAGWSSEMLLRSEDIAALGLRSPHIWYADNIRASDDLRRFAVPNGRLLVAPAAATCPRPPTGSPR